MPPPSGAVSAKTLTNARLLVTKALLKLSDFQPGATTTHELEEYAKKVAERMCSETDDAEELKDKLLCLLTNVENLDGEIRGGQLIPPEQLAVMDGDEMRSAKQKKELANQLRKRVREQENYDKTSMHCPRCNLVRRDRLNINQMGLDSDENGTQFDYNFGNMCECSERSDDSSSDDDHASDGDDDVAEPAGRARARTE